MTLLTGVAPHIPSVVPPVLLPLTHDVLYMVTTFSERQEVSSLMQTCRFLYHEGAKILLRRTVWLPSMKPVPSFVDFMAAEGFSRCRHLRGLSITPYDEPFQLVHCAAQALTRLLPRLASFNSLTQLWLTDAEVLLQCSPVLIPAIATIPSLTRIDLGLCGTLVTELLMGLKSKPTSLELGYARAFSQGPFACREGHVLVTLQGVRQSLRTLHVRGFSACPDDTLAVVLKPYLNLEDLTLERGVHPTLGPYIRACPCLKKLNIETFFCLEYDGVVDFEDLTEYRFTNLAYQTEHGTWDKLEQVTGGVYDIYAAGLSCPIEELTMRLGPCDDPQAIAAILGPTKVDYLTLWTESARVFDDDLEHGLPPILRVLPAVSPELKGLTLSILIWPTLEELHSCLVSGSFTRAYAASNRN